MTLLDFTKPTKVKIDVGFDGGPDGGYMPQMSDADAHRWKAKRFNAGKENDRIELRKSFPNNATQILIFIALDGWDLAKKYEKREANPSEQYFHKDTRGLNVRVSMNGPLLLTFEQFAEIQQIVDEAQMVLEADKPKD